jgi:hypothetical protein
MTAAGAEAWCIDLLSLPISAAPADRIFVVKLECSVRDEIDGRAEPSSTTTLTGLIELLSRKPRPTPPRWEAISPAMRLSDLKNGSASQSR